MKILVVQQLIPLALAVDLAKLFVNWNKVDQAASKWSYMDGDVQDWGWGKRSRNMRYEPQEASTQPYKWNQEPKAWEEKLVWWGNKKLPSGWGEEQQVPTVWGDGKQVPTGWGDGQQVATGWGEEQQVPTGWGERKQVPTGWGDGKQPVGCCKDQQSKGWGDQQPKPWNLY